MTSLPDILAAAVSEGGAVRCQVPSNWLQGRTAYGGLSAALALAAAHGVADDLPPLRSAQIAFIGPLAGEVTVTPTLLRRGRNAAFIQTDITSSAGLGLRATFVFMAQIKSMIAYQAAGPASAAPPSADAPLYVGPPDFFTGNFEFFDEPADTAPAEWLRWARLRERDGLHPEVELMAMGDALPPAALKLVSEFKPLSSLTWIFNLVTPAAVTRDGWWLLHASADRAMDGYSSQVMRVRNADGEVVAEGMQGVAIFA